MPEERKRLSIQSLPTCLSSPFPLTLRAFIQTSLFPGDGESTAPRSPRSSFLVRWPRTGFPPLPLLFFFRMLPPRAFGSRFNQVEVVRCPPPPSFPLQMEFGGCCSLPPTPLHTPAFSSIQGPPKREKDWRQCKTPTPCPPPSPWDPRLRALPVGKCQLPDSFFFPSKIALSPFAISLQRGVRFLPPQDDVLCWFHSERGVRSI